MSAEGTTLEAQIEALLSHVRELRDELDNHGRGLIVVTEAIEALTQAVSALGDGADG